MSFCVHIFRILRLWTHSIVEGHQGGQAGFALIEAVLAVMFPFFQSLSASWLFKYYGQWLSSLISLRTLGFIPSDPIGLCPFTFICLCSQWIYKDSGRLVASGHIIKGCAKALWSGWVNAAPADSWTYKQQGEKKSHFWELFFYLLWKFNYTAYLPPSKQSFFWFHHQNCSKSAWDIVWDICAPNLEHLDA